MDGCGERRSCRSFLRPEHSKKNNSITVFLLLHKLLKPKFDISFILQAPTYCHSSLPPASAIKMKQQKPFNLLIISSC
jgi:hypothetical protein